MNYIVWWGDDFAPDDTVRNPELAEHAGVRDGGYEFEAESPEAAIAYAEEVFGQGKRPIAVVEAETKYRLFRASQS